MSYVHKASSRLAIFAALILSVTALTSCGAKVKYESRVEYDDSSGDYMQAESGSSSAASQPAASGGTTDNRLTEPQDSKATTKKTDKTASTTKGGSTSSKPLHTDTTVDMKGYTFSIASTFLPAKLGSNPTLFEELFFERKKQVEDTYHCKINVINMYPDMATLKPYIMAGKKVADLVELGPAQIIAAAELGYIQPWNGVGPIDVKDARWAEPSDTLGVYNNKAYGLSLYRPPEVRYCVVFNKTLLRSYRIDPNSLYAAVNNGTWTFDKLLEVAKTCTKDTNNDGVYDTYGIVGPPSYIGYGLLKANGASLATKTNGKINVSVNSAAAKYALNFYYDLVNTHKVVYTAKAELGTAKAFSTVNEIKYVREFLNSKAAFLFYESWVLNQQIKPGAGSLEYGMLPYPKGPNASGYTTSADNSRLLCLTSTNTDKEKTAIIFNALAYPVDGEAGLDYWYDIQADYFQKDDTQSLDMYKLCLNTSVTDMGAASDKLFNGFFGDAIAETVYAHMSTPSEKLDSMIGVYDSALASIFKK